jgi:hypothetical protein
MDGYIAKPVRMDELAAALEGCAPRGSAAGAPMSFRQPDA